MFTDICCIIAEHLSKDILVGNDVGNLCRSSCIVTDRILLDMTCHFREQEMDLAPTRVVSSRSGVEVILLTQLLIGDLLAYGSSRDFVERGTLFNVSKEPLFVIQTAVTKLW